MKYASFLFIMAALLLTGAGCRTLPFGTTERASCSYQGATYQTGESFPAADTCNSCRCQDDGQVVCTEIACDANPASCQEDKDCERLDLDQSFCSTGEWNCVNKQCEFICNVGGRLAP